MDQQATAQLVDRALVFVDMAVEDLQTARQTGDERKIREAKEEVKAEQVEKAKEEVKEAKEEVKEAEQKVKEAKEEVQKVQEKAICCTASVWSQFFQKMQK